MANMEKTKVTVQAHIQAPIDKVWTYWSTPKHIMHWNNASPDWHTPKAENDLRTGGKFLSRMEARDGSMGFDFEGVYKRVIPHKLIEYVLADDREVKIEFSEQNGGTKVVEIFDAETTNPVEMQRGGWQAILDNFKKYTEAN